LVSRDSAADVEALKRVERRDVRRRALRRAGAALYATDASNYRQVSIGVVTPKSVEDVESAVAICRRFGAPIPNRGGGTSLAVMAPW
jgi:FAD/FMN-containing dehydrogenase